MKKFLFATALSLVLTLCPSVQASEKIAVANIASIFQQLPQRTIIAKQLEDEFKSRSSELQIQERNLQVKIQKLQRDSSSMKVSERNRIEKDILAQREKFSNKAQAFNQDKRHRQIEERNKLLSLIHDAVKKVAEIEGYDVVINSDAVAYVSRLKDITIDVLKQVK